MKLTVRGVPIEDLTLEEAMALIDRFGPDAGFPSPSPSAPNNGEGGAPTANKATARAARPEREEGEAIIPTANKAEALLRFYDEIRIEDHKKLLRILAGAGRKGLDQDQLKKRSGMDWLAGFTNAMVKRTRAYGLKKDDVLTVEKKGTVATKRIQIYRLTDDMLDMMNQHNFVDRP